MEIKSSIKTSLQFHPMISPLSLMNERKLGGELIRLGVCLRSSSYGNKRHHWKLKMPKWLLWAILNSGKVRKKVTILRTALMKDHIKGSMRVLKFKIKINWKL